ncbi:MAG TPA: lipoyl(octanoyl) transferase LipB [Bacteroidota bacterium]|nr:lipoyl(octanoyl) transferase LipB [Bacteroidota bacterium]
MRDHHRRNTVLTAHLGRTGYGPVWELQRRLFDERAAGRGADVLLLTEHDHVYTFGKGSDENHLLAGTRELQQTGAEVFRIDRGGDVTYHGPGQLVVYPILRLADYYSDVHRYLRDLEEVIIRTLGNFGIVAHRDKEFTGVWVGNEKIAAIGVRVSHWITMHGFALNVSTDLAYFDRIIPCGIFHRGVTSMAKILNSLPNLEDVSRAAINHFGDVFHCEMILSDVATISNQNVMSKPEPQACLQ